jgi:hypothetical protein
VGVAADHFDTRGQEGGAQVGGVVVATVGCCAAVVRLLPRGLDGRSCRFKRLAVIAATARRLGFPRASCAI